MNETQHDIRHNVGQRRYELLQDGKVAGFAEYALDGDTRVFNHTVVKDEFQGQGLSKPLIQAALDDTKESGHQYRATCSAVVRFIEKNPEYA